MDQRWGKTWKNILHYSCRNEQIGNLCNISLCFLSVWDRWESWWQNAGPTIQPAASQPYGSKRHLPKCQNHRISSCEKALLGVCLHAYKRQVLTLALFQAVQAGVLFLFVCFFGGERRGNMKQKITWGIPWWHTLSSNAEKSAKSPQKQSELIVHGLLLFFKEDETITFPTSVKTLKPDIGSCSHAPKALEKETWVWLGTVHAEIHKQATDQRVEDYMIAFCESYLTRRWRSD